MASGSAVPNAEKADPLTLWVWHKLRDRSVSDKSIVLNACDTRLRDARRKAKHPLSLARQDQALYAISIFVRSEGHIPNGEEWDRWRHEDEAHTHLPSYSTVRKAFGSWPQMRAELEMEIALGHIPDVSSDVVPMTVGRGAGLDVTSSRLRSNGVKFSDAELLHVLRAFASSQEGLLRRTDFLAWLQTQEPAQAGFNRWPLGLNPYRRFGRTFDEWLTVARIESVPAATPTTAAAAPVLHPLETTPQTPENTSAIYRPSSRPDVSVPIPRCTAKDWDTLGAWVRLAADDTSGPDMGVTEYEQWVKTRIESAVARGHALEAIPSASKLKDAAGGSWYDVKRLAGLPSLANEKKAA